MPFVNIKSGLFAINLLMSNEPISVGNCGIPPVAVVVVDNLCEVVLVVALELEIALENLFLRIIPCRQYCISLQIPQELFCRFFIFRMDYNCTIHSTSDMFPDAV